MEELSHFNHYFEIFAGINAALLSFDESRKFVYSFFTSVTEKHLEIASLKICSILTNAEEVAKTIEEMNSPDIKSPIEAQDISIYIEGHEIEYNQYKQRLIDKFEDSVEFEKVKIKVIPSFIFCFLYCVFLIVLSGLCESYSIVHAWCFVFLAYFNTAIILLFIIYRLKQEFAEDAISYFYKKILKKKRIKKNSIKMNVVYLKIRRNVYIFFGLIVLLTIFTYLTYQLIQHGHHCQPTWNLVIIISTFVICPSPMLILLNYARIWKNTKLRPILDEYTLINNEKAQLSSLLEKWMDGLDLANKVTYQYKKIAKK